MAGFPNRKNDRKKLNIRSILAGIALPVLAAAAVGGAVWAAPTPQFSQVINPGVLNVDILDNTQASVPNPSAALGALAVASACRPTGGSGTLGTNSQRIYVDNPGAADNGWSLAIAATGGPTAVWSDGSTTYDFNDPGSGGCSDGGDADSAVGQMTLDPSGTLTLDCGGSCSTTGVSLGSTQSFSQGSVDAIGLITAAAGSDNVWRGYLTGVDVTQSIPAGQPSGTYTIDMTLTVTAS